MVKLIIKIDDLAKMKYILRKTQRTETSAKM